MASSSSEPIFVSAIRDTLSQWKSFQLAIDNGMGGSYAHEKIVWMIQVIANFFATDSQLECDEVSHFIESILDVEFNTIIEDGSLEMVSSSLCRYYQLCCNGLHDEVSNKLNDIRLLNAQNNSINLSDNSKQLVTTMESLDICGDNNDNQNNEVIVEANDDNQWTVVQRKKKK